MPPMVVPLATLFRPVLGQKRAAGVGDGVDLLAVDLADSHEIAILQHLQGRVDRAGAGGVHAAAALLDCLHHLIAMHGPLLQQLQQRELEIAPPKEAPAAPRTAGEAFLAERAFGAKWAFRAERTAAAKEVAPHLPAQERPPVPAVPTPAMGS